MITNQHKQTSSSPYEEDLDSPDEALRREAFEALRADASALAGVAIPGKPGNLHAHTFYSFNCYGYSPARYTLLARKHGMEVAGIVDFDVLDGLDEFHTCGSLLNLRTVVSLETRVYASVFSTRVINSPGEPGVAYHMATGFARVPTGADGRKFLFDLRDRAARRNRNVTSKVNDFLAPVAIDYEKDVLSLTPMGNATERHLVLAYARKAAQIAGDGLLEFWTSKLGAGILAEDLPESPKLLNLIRAKTMKQGGAGYVLPGATSFPPMAEFNKFALACGALPTVAWLDGTSPGEQRMDEFCDNAAKSGVCALNVIPDRNFTPGVKDQKLRNLYDVIDLAHHLGWPVIAGTEMNSPGQKFVDDFDSAELKPLVPTFQRGARILYAHTALQRAAEIGYAGDWADRFLPQRVDRNEFFEEIGSILTPRRETALAGLDRHATPSEILHRIRKKDTAT